MEKVLKKPRIPIYLLILALVLVAAIAVGIYFLVSGSDRSKPNRGTYVCGEVIGIEQGHHQA
jgi:uncharacterized protein (UPF0333 family)